MRKCGREKGACPLFWAATLLVVLLAPSAGRAGCGDHVVFKTPPDARLTSPAPSAENEIPHVPCRGFACSRGPTVPPVAPATPAPSVDDLWGRLILTDALPSPEPRAFLDRRDFGRPIRRADPVDPPPRGA